eukprot:1139200-Pelagomonas_calceolata.AAC.3
MLGRAARNPGKLPSLLDLILHGYTRTTCLSCMVRCACEQEWLAPSGDAKLLQTCVTLEGPLCVLKLWRTSADQKEWGTGVCTMHIPHAEGFVGPLGRRKKTWHASLA